MRRKRKKNKFLKPLLFGGLAFLGIYLAKKFLSPPAPGSPEALALLKKQQEEWRNRVEHATPGQRLTNPNTGQTIIVTQDHISAATATRGRG